MKNVVGYHNADKMGYSFRGAEDPLAFVTKKAADHLVGARVWSIAGEGSPWEYFCGGWFIVDRVEPSPSDPSMRNVRGTVGRVYKPMIRLNELPWFSRFRESQANFSLGLQTINEAFVPHLEALGAEPAPAAGRDLRTDAAPAEPRSKTEDASKWPEYDGPKGMALYVVDMVDCYPAEPKHASGAGCMPSPGEWVWELRNVRKLSRPVPVKGSLSFYAPTKGLWEQLYKDGFLP